MTNSESQRLPHVHHPFVVDGAIGTLVASRLPLLVITGEYTSAEKYLRISQTPSSQKRSGSAETDTLAREKNGWDQRERDESKSESKAQ